mmetsp:Transcript_37599/g.78022  ORF Transcript_37599/g.78022 Transcript_37599/m.78022 type:complete len:81 (-) Transcript_37599:382-624(-)
MVGTVTIAATHADRILEALKKGLASIQMAPKYVLQTQGGWGVKAAITVLVTTFAMATAAPSTKVPVWAGKATASAVTMPM